SEALESFLKAKADRLKRRTLDDYERLIRRHFDFGTKSLASIAPSDVTGRLQSLRSTPSEQHHAFTAIRAFFNWCVRQGHLDASPVDRIAPTDATPARDRILSDSELFQVLEHAKTFTKPFGTLIQLLVYTGLRRSEASHLHRDWIDSDLLTIPGALTKNGHPHTIPLVPTAVQLLEGLPDQLFVSTRGVIFSNWGNSKKRFDEQLPITPWRIHDLRRTFSSRHARLGTPIHVTEKMLNHISGSFGGVQGIYNRYDYIEEMREALEKYEKHIHSLLA
ncbi:MAG: tyrosine-type recombinase/integrase, partial [Cyanobacteria bacterium J06636_16]